MFHMLTNTRSRSDYARMRGFFILLLLCVTAVQARAQCGLADLGQSAVAAVRDGATLVLADGREVRLAGIEASADAPSVVRELAQGRNLRLAAASTEPSDRYGRVLAFATAEGTTETVQEALIARGLARVSARVGSRSCADRLLALEDQARTARRGLWANPNFAPFAAEPGRWMDTELGRFVLVEGKVVSVRQSGGTIYVNFGRRFTRDFSVAVPRRLQAAFRAAGRDPQGFTGHRIRVRGWLERRTGPTIELAAPEQIELLD
jgi:endonuclease YncB( thermonuclease family)